MSKFYQKLAKADKGLTQDVIKLFNEKGHDQETFCIVPFTNIILEPDGKVGMCRQQGSDFPIGNIKKNTISEIWNGEKARRWRREFLTGKVKKCKNHIKYDHCNLCSHNNAHYESVELEEVQTRPIIKLTANLNGRCNLECIMCHIWRKPNDIYNEENFWIPARKDIFPTLKELELLSGEPFIQQDTYKLIDEVSSVNPSCDWFITTNAHWNLNNKIISYLDKIKIRDFIISIDSVNPETYSKIRIKGNVDIVKNNIRRLQGYNQSRKEPFNFRFNFLVVHENWREVKDMLDFCAENEAHPFIDFCYMPKENSLLTLDHEKRVEILNYYIKTLSWDEFIFCMRVINPLLDSLDKLAKAEILIRINELRKRSNAA